MKILVIEFEKVLRESIAGSLRQRGHEVLTAPVAKDGLRLYRRHGGIDFVLSGLHLDGKTSGAQLVQRVKSINVKQPCGFVSSNDPILITPFSANELCSFVESQGRRK